MKITAVICEFNPFHNGHAYLLQRARELTGCDAVLCVMSGNFVQRARPAVADMRTRAQAALLCGADAVIELPALYAAAVGQRFAEGAMNLINSIPCVTHLIFGSESGDLVYLTAAARVQAEEPAAFKAELKKLLDEGKPYAGAYARATELELNRNCQLSIVNYQLSTDRSNDLLGAEYLKQLILTDSKITPMAVKRIGAGYHDTDAVGAFASATAIRGFLESGDADAAKQAMPEPAFELFNRQDKSAYAASGNAFDLLLVYALRVSDPALCPDAGEGLESKLKKAARQFTAFSDILLKAKSKRYTAARINRLALQSLLCVTHYPDLTGFAVPAKLIGVKKTTQNEILSALPKNIVIKNKDFSTYAAALPPAEKIEANYIWQINKTAASIYSLINACGGNGYDDMPLLIV